MTSKLDNIRSSKFGIALFYGYLVAILVFGVFMVYALNHLRSQDANQVAVSQALATLTQKACVAVDKGRIEGNKHVRLPLKLVLNQAANIVEARTSGAERLKFEPTIRQLRHEAQQIKPLPRVRCQFEGVTK